MAKMTSAQHYEISEHCVAAMDMHYDQHVFEAMMYHDGMGSFREQQDRARVAIAAAQKARRQNADPMGINAALKNLQRK